jgi:hypothetical protein
MTSTWGLFVAIGVLSAGGAGMAGPQVLMAATTRLVPANKQGMAAGIVNAGGSFGQFVFAPIAQGITAAAGWVTALQSLGRLHLADAAVGLGAAHAHGREPAWHDNTDTECRRACRAGPCVRIAELSMPMCRILCLRVPRGVHCHASARGSGELPIAAGSRGLVAGA